MILSKPVLVCSRLEIFLDSGQDQRLQYFAAAQISEIGRYEVPMEVSQSGFCIRMISKDFHIDGN